MAPFHVTKFNLGQSDHLTLRYLNAIKEKLSTKTVSKVLFVGLCPKTKKKKNLSSFKIFVVPEHNSLSVTSTKASMPKMCAILFLFLTLKSVLFVLQP